MSIDDYDDYDEYEAYQQELAEQEEAHAPPGTEESEGSITAVPTLHDYQKRYALSCSNNDQKAVRLFKEYESMEKVRRLQAELMWVSSGQVYSPVLDSILGKTRKAKYNGYNNWAKLMLLWISQFKRA